MEIRLAIKEELSLIHNLVQNTIKQIYKNYYPIEVVNFFCMHHSFDNIRKDLNDNKVYLLTNKDEIIGTGTILDNHITRVFVHPKHQKLGYGNLLMTYLENKIADDYNMAILDSSLAASIFYEKRGYVSVKHEVINVENNKYLVYEIMEKKLKF